MEPVGWNFRDDGGGRTGASEARNSSHSARLSGCIWRATRAARTRAIEAVTQLPRAVICPTSPGVDAEGGVVMIMEGMGRPSACSGPRIVSRLLVVAMQLDILFISAPFFRSAHRPSPDDSTGKYFPHFGVGQAEPHDPHATSFCGWAGPTVSSGCARHHCCQHARRAAPNLAACPTWSNNGLCCSSPRSCARKSASCSGFSASLMACPIYSSSLVAIHSGWPAAVNRLTPTRAMCRSPASVTTGTPIQSASQVVVVPL